MLNAACRIAFLLFVLATVSVDALPAASAEGKKDRSGMTTTEILRFSEAMGLYLKDDHQAALPVLKEFAERGDATAQLLVGDIYSSGKGVIKDDVQATYWYRKSAEQGAPRAQFALAERYFHGVGVAADPLQAIYWWSKLAEQGDTDAQLNLAIIYGEGRGVPKNTEKSLHWYRRAADQGSAVAQFSLGVAYLHGQGVAKDLKQAVYWWRKAAEQKYARAHTSLGMAFEEGWGVPKDKQQAFKWYRSAAEQGQTVAQFKLGWMFSKGLGVPKDAKQAVHWWRKAAEQGDGDAQTNLGVMYAKGEGVPKNEQSAYFWFLLASATDANEVSAQFRDRIEQRLTASQRESAQALARDWRAKTEGEPKVGAQTERSDGAASATRLPAADRTGTGFRVTQNQVMTNHHVSDRCTRLSINGVGGTKVAAVDASSDLALLATEGSTGAFVELRSERAVVGESVAVAGYPLRGLLSGFNLTIGSVSSLSGLDGDTRFLQITAPVQPGNSGGPLLDQSGNLIGIVTSKLDAVRVARATGDIPQNVNFAINANALRSFLDAHDVNYHVGRSSRQIQVTSIAERAKAFTVLVECWE